MDAEDFPVTNEPASQWREFDSAYALGQWAAERLATLAQELTALPEALDAHAPEAYAREALSILGRIRDHSMKATRLMVETSVLTECFTATEAARYAGVTHRTAGKWAADPLPLWDPED